MRISGIWLTTIFAQTLPVKHNQTDKKFIWGIWIEFAENYFMYCGLQQT